MKYVTFLEGIDAGMLEGFFVGWPDPPSPDTLLRILEGSSCVVLALDEEDGRVVGLVTGLTDGVLAASIPLLEVLPDWRGRGIGSELMRRMLSLCEGLYMIDLTCDRELETFYSRLGMQPYFCMMLRNGNAQSGRNRSKKERI